MGREKEGTTAAVSSATPTTLFPETQQRVWRGLVSARRS